jgi:hypothetical protein
MDLYERYKNDPMVKAIDTIYVRVKTIIYMSLVVNLAVFGVTLTLVGFNLISFHWPAITGFLLALSLGAAHLCR